MSFLPRLVIRMAAPLVPRRARSRWREEWLAEIGSRGTSAGALPGAMGAPWDAVLLRWASVRDAFRMAAAGWQTDARQAARALWHGPSHVATAVICLGIGAAVSVSLFSALNALLFGDVPGISDRASLVRVFVGYEAAADAGGPDAARAVTPGPLSTSDLEIIAAGRGSALTGVAAEGDWPFVVSFAGAPVPTSGAFVPGDYFTVLGTQPSAGRMLRAEDDRSDAPPAAVIGYHLWRDRLGGADIVGRPILVSDRLFTVVGIAPPRFTGVRFGDIGDSPLNYIQLWIPLRHAAGWPGVPHREIPWHTVVGRLASGATLAGAEAELAAGAARLAAAYPATRRAATVVVRRHGLGPNDTPVELLMFLAVLLSLPLTVLLIGCANVANLQLARATERAREFSVRVALGASRAQVVRLLTFEAAALAVLAVGAGWLGARLIIIIAQPSFPVVLALDGRVLTFAALLVAGVTVLSGLAPAWWGTRRSGSFMLRQSTATPAVALSRLRHALVVVQMALSLALLSTSGLFAASLRAMHGEVPPSARSTLVTSMNLETLNYTSAETQRFRDEIMTRFALDARVEAVSAERLEGLRYWSATDAIDAKRYALGAYVTPSWFATAGARIVEGRPFSPADAGAAVVVSDRMARLISPGQSAVGTLLYLTSSTIVSQSPDRVVMRPPRPGAPPERAADRIPVTIVGVVADIPRRPGDARPDPVVYRPLPADAAGAFTLRVRTNDPDTLLAHVRDVVGHAEPRLAIEVDTAEALFLRESGTVRALALSIGGLGFVALVLAAAGLYAVMAYLVSLRRHEIGIRLAIGARPADVLRLVLEQGVRLGLAGSVVGVAIATLVAMSLRAALVGVSAFDPVAMLPPAAVLVAVAIIASVIPARRAARIDPIRALRCD
jgi:predicted permease